MQKHICNEQNGLHYTQHGNVYLPDLAYSKNDYPPLGKYGMLRKTYLQEHHKAVFSKMLLRDELWPHLLEIDEQAHAMVETMVAQMAKAEGLTEKMKSTDPLRWVGLMNNFKNAAEEIVLQEIVYG
ncbi:MAG: TnpV protein [Clostridia bacterium]|nr:TnpV protein [Clostridia bacterium]